MLYSQRAIFYGHDDYFRNLGITSSDICSEIHKPMINDFVKSKEIRERICSLLENGATPTDNYEHDIYICPKCKRLFGRFFFQLLTEKETYEPEYRCSHCCTLLKRVDFINENTLIKVVYKNNKNANWHCPECGNAKLVYDNYAMMWD